jgi:hypothetical protein
MKATRSESVLLALALTLLIATTAWGARGTPTFAEKETSAFLFGDYLEHGDNHWGGGYSIDYFVSQWFGLGITSHWEEWHGAAYDNLAAEMYIRIPIQSWRLAPYAVGTAGYDFEENEWFEGVGGGLEYRFSPKFGLTADYQYLFRDVPKDGGFIRFGIRLGF